MSELKPCKCKGCGKEPTLRWTAGGHVGNTFYEPHYTISCECGQTLTEMVLRPLYTDQQKAKNKLIRRWNNAQKGAEV